MSAAVNIIADEIFEIPATGEPDWMGDQMPDAKMISGFGIEHTNKYGRKLAEIDWAGIRELVENPQNVPKDKAQWVILSTLHSRNHAEQFQRGVFGGLWGDLDEATQTLEQVQCVLAKEILGSNTNYELFASKSATEQRQKGRILIEAIKPLSGADWKLCEQVFNDKLEAAGIVPDRKSEATGQVCYLPNRGEFYAAFSKRDGIAFDPMAEWASEIAEKRLEATKAAADAARRKEEAAARREARKHSGQGSLIDAFNDVVEPGELMLMKGYDQDGNSDRYRHPASESGNYSASVKNDRVHSLSSADPLYTGGSGGGAHDSFSVFVVLFHDGNDDAAMKDAGNNWVTINGQPWNKVKRREYMKDKARSEAAAYMKPIDPDAGEPEEAPNHELRAYEDILAEAESMNADTPPAEIQRIAVECKELEPIECRKVFMSLKRCTGIPLGTLTAAMKTNDEGDEEPDHLQLATEVIRSTGPENIFEAQSFVWLWDGSGVWRKNEDRAVKQLVQNAIPNHAAEVYKSLVDGVTDVLKNEVYRPHHEFNIGPVETVNCPNGEVSLGAAWELHPHVRENYRTTQIPVIYDPAAKAPRFEQFLTEVFKGDPDAEQKRDAVLEMIGYTLMAHCRHEKFVVLVGCGANGKSVLLSLLEALVGSKNVAGVQPHQFDNVFQRGHLHCKLANIVSEIRQGEVINDAALKGIVSGELTTVEHKNRDPFEMRPFATCWFGTNHMPHTKDDSDGFFRRALVLTFNNVFKPELGNADPHLKDKLKEELPGILNIALNAYDIAINIAGSFTVPSSSRKATEDWKLESDQVAQFFEEECEKRPYSKHLNNHVYSAYEAWAEESGIRNLFSKKRFSQRLELLGVGKERTNADRFFTGIYCKRAEKTNIEPLSGAWRRTNE